MELSPSKKRESSGEKKNIFAFLSHEKRRSRSAVGVLLSARERANAGFLVMEVVALREIGKMTSL